MDRDALLALAERVEKATGPDRELDAEIAVAVDGGEIVWLQQNYTMGMYPARKYALSNYVGGYGRAPVPTYTASLDSAMTLVPEGHEWIRKSPRSMTVYQVPADEKSWAIHHDAAGATPALALTAASLRAIAAGER